MTTSARSVADRRISEFSNAGNDLTRHHHEAMECRDCEVFIQMGIDAFNWMCLAETTARQDLYQNPHGWAEDEIERFENHVKESFRTWFNVARTAENWVQRQIHRGFDVDNYGRFQECYRQVSAIVAAFDDKDVEVMPEPLTVLRDEALDEFKNGKTADFFSGTESDD